MKTLETETGNKNPLVFQPINTLQQGIQAIAVIEASKQTSNKYSNNKQQTKNKNARIGAIKVMLNNIQSRLKKNNWVEIEFQDLPMGTVFHCKLSLTAKRTKFGGVNQTGAKEYKFMKSSGYTCFVLNPGYDQGSMLTLDPRREVWARYNNKTHIANGRPNGTRKDSMNDDDDEFEEGDEL